MHLRRPAVALALGAAVLPAAGCAPAISTQQEVQLGAQQANEINRQLPLVSDRAVVSYINDLGRSIARNADPRGIQYSFYVVNSNQVNAFAIPGGHVYVNRGLVERADNVSELAGVLGHEIAHVVERHGIEQWQRAQNANLGLSLLYGVLLGRNPGGLEQAGVQLAGGAYFASYGRGAEREADMLAIQYTTRTGIHPRGIVTFFQELLNERKRNPSRVEQWFATHPLTEERIADTSQAITALNPSPNLAMDSQAFQQFRARVRSLPAARQ
ncbi:MAG: M48 family metallopeptidase [Gemmatimonadota bacterium]|nr:M48 family metallopeptidase [Gemmatimonadota bacterium]